MVIGLKIDLHSKPYPIKFDSIKEIFKDYTIVGACIEENLVIVGQLNATEENKNIPDIEKYEHDGLYGPVIILQTDTDGNIIDIKY